MTDNDAPRDIYREAFDKEFELDDGRKPVTRMHQIDEHTTVSEWARGGRHPQETYKLFASPGTVLHADPVNEYWDVTIGMGLKLFFNLLSTIAGGIICIPVVLLSDHRILNVLVVCVLFVLPLVAAVYQRTRVATMWRRTQKQFGMRLKDGKQIGKDEALDLLRSVQPEPAPAPTRPSHPDRPTYGLPGPVDQGLPDFAGDRDGQR